MVFELDKVYESATGARFRVVDDGLNYVVEIFQTRVGIWASATGGWTGMLWVMKNVLGVDVESYSRNAEAAVTRFLEETCGVVLEKSD